MKNYLSLYGVALLALATIAPAAAYDAQCDTIKQGQRRALCQCRTDAGATVRVSPNQRGEVTVRETGVPSKRLGEVHACMTKKGYTPA